MYKDKTSTGDISSKFDEGGERDLSSIYAQLSVGAEDNFEQEQLLEKLNGYLLVALDDRSRCLEASDLIGDQNQLNLAFVTYIKYCAAREVREVGMEFTVFCDYFDLPYDRAYALLHDKLKALVRASFKKMVGAANFNKMNRRLNPNSDVRTLFDMVASENLKKQENAAK